MDAAVLWCTAAVAAGQKEASRLAVLVLHREHRFATTCAGMAWTGDNAAPQRFSTVLFPAAYNTTRHALPPFATPLPHWVAARARGRCRAAAAATLPPRVLRALSSALTLTLTHCLCHCARTCAHCTPPALLPTCAALPMACLPRALPCSYRDGLMDYWDFKPQFASACLAPYGLPTMPSPPRMPGLLCPAFTVYYLRRRERRLPITYLLPEPTCC